MKTICILIVFFLFTGNVVAQTIAANNGIQRVVDSVKLGGPLTSPTIISLGANNLLFKTNFNSSEKWTLNNADGHIFMGDSANIPILTYEIPGGISYLGRQNAAALILAKKKTNNGENVDLFAMTTADAATRNGWLFQNYSNSIGNVSPRLETYSNASDAWGYSHELYVKSSSTFPAYRILIKDYDKLNTNGDKFHAVNNRILYSIENGDAQYTSPSYTLFSIDSLGKWSGYAYKNTDSNKVLTSDINGALKLKSLVIPTPDGSETKVTAGANVTVSGTGTILSPYVVSADSYTVPLQWNNSTIGSGNIVNSNTGAVIIGNAVSSIPSGYKLYVADGILTEKIKVALRSSANWADFVFSKNYKMLSLSETESFINKNKHLPGLPSAKILQNEGIDVLTMLSKQMQKIEELTLHLIKMDKKINKLEKENKKLKAFSSSHK
jgi:hypothetical protein